MATPIAVPGTMVQYMDTGSVTLAAIIVTLAALSTDYTQPLQLITFSTPGSVPTMTLVSAQYSDGGEVGTWHFLPLPK